MNKQLVSAAALILSVGSAFAADLPSRKAAPLVPPPPPPPMWTGFYGGLNIGGNVGTNSAVTSCLVPESRDANLVRETEGALWQEFFTAAPGQRREFEPSSKRRKRRQASSPSDMA